MTNLKRHSHFVDNPVTKLGLITVVVLSILSGALISISSEVSFYVLGVLGVIVYALLAFFRPFAAFLVLILAALTVWISSIKVMGDISMMIGLGLILGGVWLSRLALRITTLIRVREYGFLLGLTAVVLISALSNFDGTAGLSSIATYLQLYVLFVLVINFATTPARLRALSGVVILSSTLVGLVILADQLGWLPQGLVVEQLAGVNLSGSMQVVTRTGGLWGDANFTALQMIVGLPFIIGWWPFAAKWTQALLVAATVIILAAFTYTFSTAGVVGILVILTIKAFRDSRRSKAMTFVRVVLVSMVAILLFTVILPDLFVERVLMKLNVITSALSTQDTELWLQVGSSRGDTWQAAAHTIAESPIIGHGPGNGTVVNTRHSAFYGDQASAGAHNMYLSVGGDLGLLGLALFAGLLISAILAVKTPHGFGVQEPSLLWMGEALFVALLTAAVVGLSLDTQNLKLLWIMMGMAVAFREVVGFRNSTPDNERKCV